MCKKNNSSIKLQDGPFDHKTRKVPVEDLTFNIFVNFLIY